jgi:predicted O-linked N-acetylglucosamine transferase (SPINDLY family)
MNQSPINLALAQALEHFQAGRLGDAEAIYRRILSQDPNVPDALQMLGVIAAQVNQPDAALELIRRAIARAPGIAQYHNNLGLVLLSLGRVDDAIEKFKKAIALQPDFPLSHNNLGTALKQKSQPAQALACFNRTLELQPDSFEAMNNLATILQEFGRVKESIQLFNEAIALSPNYVQAHNNLGNALKLEGRTDEAIAAYQKALSLSPNLAVTYNNLGNAFLDVSRIEDSVAAYERAISIQPADATFRSNRLFALHMLPNIDQRQIFQDHLKWDQMHGPPLRSFIQPHSNDRSTSRRLKVGYVSPDFREHSVSYFVQSLLAAHDPRAVEIFCYADLNRPDQITEKLKSLSHHWHDITGLKDEQAAALIRGHKIDILVDLAGHTARNRLLVFAAKPAPVQITWLGYPDTTGLSAMDYRLSDAFADPPGATEQYHSEKLLRLPRSFLCFTAPTDAPDVAPAPGVVRGRITLGCVNGLPKINPPMIAIWSEILQALPGSRLMLKSKSFADASARLRMADAFGRHGISPDRLELREWIAARGKHLALFNEIDIALDTFPYNGTTTTCEAMWMGVPVVTLAGQHHASRVGASLLNNVGLTELIATSPREYVEIAEKLGNDLPRLMDARAGLRKRMENSPLTNAPLFARSMETAYRNVWREWCEAPNV